jgi:hypothetical protein
LLALRYVNASGPFKVTEEIGVAGDGENAMESNCVRHSDTRHPFMADVSKSRES